MHFEELAQQLVQTASTLLNGRIVNIMDTRGIIVASTEAPRIGTRHEGACQVLRTRRPVAAPLSKMAQALEQALGRPVRLCAGSPCTSVRQIHRAGAEAAILCDMDRTGVLDIQDASCRFFYLMQRASTRDAGFIDDMVARLARQFGDKELEVLLTTARAYYNCNGSVAQAAALLHVHKNTLQYRMHRLWDTLCPGDASPFEREYLLRLCIMRGLHG